MRHQVARLAHPAVGGVLSADVTASIANEAARLPAAQALVVGDFHNAVPAACGNMIGLVERRLAFLNGEAPSPRPGTGARPVPDV
jgi:hypothetical protein